MPLLTAYVARSKSSRRFNPMWFAGREKWLRFDPVQESQHGVMRCLACIKYAKSSPWAQPSGCRSIEQRMVEEHENSEMHQKAFKTDGSYLGWKLTRFK